ncbi:hypothetical protein J2739_005004 [Variovorax soli]|uniref:Uncharacterized protein n=2 Tax=Variovorax soli TaxID=376815 RepID=A0ABU1NL64_9BURK|nr:hypothetical protein [Variovorax soli]
MQMQFLDEGIDNSHRVVFADIVVEALRQQSDLLSVLAFDESLHVAALQYRCHNLVSTVAYSTCFHTASADCGTADQPG